MGRLRDPYCSILCVLLVAGSVLATIPVVEMGTNDDWAYAWIAQRLATSGHFQYNGWSAAIIGAQAVWAALLIRLFGFSFTLLRLSTLPFAAGCAVLVYLLGRRAGLNPPWALFGSVSVTLSPVFIPLAASFMTDVPSCFFWLSAAYCCLRATHSGSAREAVIWMVVAAIAGSLGGTIRQVVWFVPLLALPVVAGMRRTERATVVSAVLLWCGSALAMGLCLHWFHSQPYTNMQSVWEPEPWTDLLEESGESVVQITVECLLMMMPILVLSLAGWRKWLRMPMPLGAGLAASGALLAALWLFDDNLLLGNIITPAGMLSQGVDLLGRKPEILKFPVRFVLGAVCWANTGLTAAMLWNSRRSSARDREGLRTLVLMLGPSCLVYVAALVYRSVREWLLFDRYLILLMPLIAIGLLWFLQERVRTVPTAWNWAVVAVFALFGIAVTHDYLAAERARLAAATAVTSAGVPRANVAAGFEYDGWTQLELDGHVLLPSEPIDNNRRYPVSPPYWFWAKIPGVKPKYVVTYSRLPELAESPFPPVRFTTWLPPFEREVFTQKARQ